MGFLDDIKSRLPFGQGQASYGQDGYDEGDGYNDYYDGFDSRTGHHLLYNKRTIS